MSLLLALIGGEPEPPVVVEKAAGGIGHGKGKSAKKTVFIERDGKYLLFKNNQDAAAYVAAEKAIEKAQESSREEVKKPVVKAKVEKAIPEPQVIDLKALEAFYAEQNLALQIKQTIAEMVALREFETLLDLQIKLKAYQDEEDDIEAILLLL